ncbi:MAG TPA: ATP-dependent metallopeptidase FtsH/Yme1/Tma family protein, partial [Gaiellales bacterium]|nr:ATP-dependent metallopeptidase FtsH/Yme1/Tma family protein [Gaiellales bacterium]
MSRFFKSAAFPIIVVVVLAFFAQRMIIDNSGSSQAHTWNDFMTAASTGKVEYLKTNEGDNSLKYSTTASDGSATTTIGVPSPDSLEAGIAAAKSSNPALVYEGTSTGGSPWWSILTYILPFVLFFGFWIFLMNQVQGGGSKVMSFGKSR